MAFSQGMRTISALFLLLLLLLLLSTPAQAGDRQEGEIHELKIGLIPEMNVFRQMDRFRPLGEYLSRTIGVEINFTILSRYGNLVESFKRDGLDGAFFGSFTGALAIEQLKVVPLARPVNLDGRSTYHGVIYTRKDSGIKKVADMSGKKFAFVEKATTAGYVYPLAYLKEHGVEDPADFFSEYFFAGSHDASLHAVLNGNADIGASKNTVFDWVRSSEPRVDEEIEILASSSPVPSNGLCVRSDLPAPLQAALKEALLSLKDRNILEKFKALEFIETRVSDYQPVFDLARRAAIDLKNYHYVNK